MGGDCQGEVIENKKAPTVGWGPAVFTMALVGAFGYWVYSNDPLVEVTAEDGTVQMVKSMSVKVRPRLSLPPSRWLQRNRFAVNFLQSTVSLSQHLSAFGGTLIALRPNTYNCKSPPTG
jgi:hypothetical protein